jgi:hypothetical protein
MKTVWKVSGIVVAISSRQRRSAKPGDMSTSLRMESRKSINDQEEGRAKMKFYIAGHRGVGTDDMDYKKIGGDQDLYGLFPELKEVITRYQIKSIDIRFSNFDRLRIYDICKISNRSLVEPIDNHHEQNSIAAQCRENFKAKQKREGMLAAQET